MTVLRQEAFVDSAKLESLSGLTLGINRPTKHPANPLFAPPQNTYQHHVVYVSAVRDPKTGRIFFYYGNKTQTWGSGRMSLAVSEPDDGVNFARPNLGLFTLDGNSNNSCVIDSVSGDPGTNHNDFPFVTYEPGVGYIALGSHNPYPEPIPGHWYAGIWISQDGINFPSTPNVRIDTNVTTRDAIGPIVRRPDGRWVVFMQSRTGANIRSVGYWLSDGTDLATTTWSGPTDFMLTGPSPTYQYYSFGAWRDGEITYAAVLIYDGTGYYQTPPYFITTNTQDRQFKFELWATRAADCVTGWTRIDADWMWSGANAGALDTTPGEWDYGCMINGGIPVRVGNQWFYYYGGGREQHHPSPPGPNGTQPWTQREAGAALIPYRRIGKASGTGSVVLSSVSPSRAGTIEINSVGSVKVELLDSGGSPIAGYAQSDCDPIPSDTYGHVVTWNGSKDTPVTTFKTKLYVTSGSVSFVTVADTSVVGQSVSMPSSVGLAHVGEGVSQPYSVNAHTGLSLDLPFEVQTIRASRTLDQSYSIQNRSGASVDLSYRVDSLVGRSLGFGYAIPATTIAYQADRRLGPPQIAYETLRQIAVGTAFPRGRSLSMEYSLAPPVSVTLAQPYNVNVVTSRSLQQSFAILAPVGRGADIGYTIKTTIGRSLDLTYEFPERAGRSLTQPYSAIVFAGRGLGSPYIIGYGPAADEDVLPTFTKHELREVVYRGHYVSSDGVVATRTPA